MKCTLSAPLLFVLACCCLQGATTSWAAPVNDNFASASTLVTGTAVTGTNVAATMQAGEAIPAAYDASSYASTVWWNWTAPSSGVFNVNTIGSDFDTVLAVWTGSAVNALTAVADDDESGGSSTSALSFTAAAGTVYRIAVAGWGPGITGNVNLVLSAPAPPPPNDNFANAILISGALPKSIAITGFDSATTEAGEPPFRQGTPVKTVWWKWIPTSATPVILSAGAGYESDEVGVFTGGSVGSLAGATAVVASQGSFVFTPVAGTTYYLRVSLDPFSGARSTSTLSIRVWNPPVNNNWANATNISGALPLTVVGTEVDGSLEAGEPGISSNSTSTWYKWTATVSGPVQVLTDAYYNDPVQLDFKAAYVDIFTGSSLVTLTPITPSSSNAEFAAFNATVGTVYYIRISKPDYAADSPSVSIILQTGPPPPANNAFASAVVMSGVPSAVQTGTIVSASTEVNEPPVTSGGSVWYVWTAATTGKVGLALNVEFGTVQLQAFTGSTVGALTQVGTSDLSQFSATAGVAYRFQVSGSQTSIDDGGFTLQTVPVPANDNFASASVIAAAVPTYTTGTTAGAGAETAGAAGGEFNRTVWYKWTAGTTQKVTFTLASLVESSPELEVFTGTALATLTSVASGDSVLSLPAVGGTAYYLRVRSAYSGDFGAFGLSLALPPANDNFASATLLTGAKVVATGNMVGATTEVSEPSSGNQTLWWRWTAPSAAHVTIRATLQDGSTPRINVWEGTALTSLTGLLGSHGQVALDPVAGTVYRIQVGSYSIASMGTVSLGIFPLPANDNFSTATNITGTAPITVTGWNVGASGEVGEPKRGQSYMTGSFNSVWWTWTAPNTNLVAIDTLGSNFDTTLHVYQGTGLNALTLIRASDEAAADHTSRVAFVPVSGATYRIRVAGTRLSRQGDVTMRLQQYVAPTTAAGRLLYGRAALEAGTAAELANADTHFAAALTLAPTNQEAIVLRAITRIGRLQQQAGFTTLLSQWGFTTKRANLVSPRYLPTRTTAGAANPPGTANTSQALTFANATLLPELATFETSLATITSTSFSLPLTDAETCLRYLTIDQSDLKTLRAIGLLLKALTHCANTYNTDLSVKTMLDLKDGDVLDAERLVNAASTLLQRRVGDERTSAKTAFKAANTLYQPAFTAMQTRVGTASSPNFLFYMPADEATYQTERTQDLNDAALSLDGPVTWDGVSINLSAFVTTATPLRTMLPKLKGNKAVASTAPDASFGGAVPAGTQSLVNQFLKNNRLLHDVSSFAAWMDNYLGDHDVEDQLAEADPDGDGFPNYAEYVFSMDPNKVNRSSDFEATGAVPNPANGNQLHLNYSFVRLKSSSPVTYKVLVSNNLVTWDATEAQLEQVGSPVTQPDGVSEQVTFRLKQASAVNQKKFLKVQAVSVP